MCATGAHGMRKLPLMLFGVLYVYDASCGRSPSRQESRFRWSLIKLVSSLLTILIRAESQITLLIKNSYIV